MSAKKTKVFYENLAQQRNHRLIQVTNEETPSQGDVVVHCNSCGNDFETTAKSYQNARKTGCPHCKAINAKNQSNYNKKPKTPAQVITPIAQTNLSVVQKESLERNQAQTNERILKRGKFQRTFNVYDRGQLLGYLKSDANPYNEFMLDALAKEQTLLDDSVKSKTKQVHHIIPRHAGGPDAKWNLVYLTPENHCKAHEIRYEVFGEFGDYNFLQTQGSEVLSRIKANPEFEQKLLEQRQNANQNARPRFENDDGSKASQAVLAGLSAEAQKIYRERHQSQMSEPVRNVLQKGATFHHAGTNTTFILQPREAPTLTELKDLLAAALPVGHVDRVRLETTPKPINVTTAIGKMIKGVKDRPSAYGWKLIKTN